MKRSSYSCCPARLKNKILGMHWKETWLQSKPFNKWWKHCGHTPFLSANSTHYVWNKFIPLLQFGFSNYSSILHKHFLCLNMCMCMHMYLEAVLDVLVSSAFQWEYGCLVHPQTQEMLRGKCWPDYCRVKARKHLL